MGTAEEESIKKVKVIASRYNEELNEIEDLLTKLKDKKIYGVENNNSKLDGGLVKNIDDLKKKIHLLIKKIVLEEDSISEQRLKMFEK